MKLKKNINKKNLQKKKTATKRTRIKLDIKKPTRIKLKKK